MRHQYVTKTQLMGRNIVRFSNYAPNKVNLKNKANLLLKMFYEQQPDIFICICDKCLEMSQV